MAPNEKSWYAFDPATRDSRQVVYNVETSSVEECRKSVSAGIFEQSVGNDEIACCRILLRIQGVTRHHVPIAAVSSSTSTGP